MNYEAASVRLDGVRAAIQAARDANLNPDTKFAQGLDAGLRIALDTIERELHWAKELEKALASVKQ